jgi:hypothetical protein
MGAQGNDCDAHEHSPVLVSICAVYIRVIPSSFGNDFAMFAEEKPFLQSLPLQLLRYRFTDQTEIIVKATQSSKQGGQRTTLTQGRECRSVIRAFRPVEVRTLSTSADSLPEILS